MLMIGQVAKRPQPMRGRLAQYNKQREGHLKDGERSEQNYEPQLREQIQITGASTGLDSRP